ncbi:MAG: peptidylprolyl isomerase [Pyrinomonadaceae bacterium]
MKKISVLILFLAASVSAQVPTATHVAILKAEDARRFDKTLEDLLKSANEQVRIRAALAAGRIGNDAAILALMSMLEKGTEKESEMAVFALGEIESIKAADAILAALKAETRAVASVPVMAQTFAIMPTPGRLKAELQTGLTARLVEAAGKIAAANAKDEKSKALGEAILNVLAGENKKSATRSTEVIRLGLTAALRARPAGADEVVKKFLSYSDPNVVADALNTLARLRAKNANGEARDLLAKSADAVVRANAARLLGAAEDKEAVDILIKAATTDADPRVRISAIRSLASIKDAKAAEPLLARGETLFAAYAKAKKPNFIPNEQSEFIEIATALGRLLPNTENARADKLFADFGKLDKGHATEVYIARVRIFQKRGDGKPQELIDWRQYSTLAQVVGEFAAIEPTSEVGKQMKTEAPNVLRPLAKAFAEADPSAEGKNMMAAPDVLQAYARFKTDDLGEIALIALKNKDVQVRATAAGILADLPASKENVDALKTAFTKALLTDKTENDAQLAILESYVKLHKDDPQILQDAWQQPDVLVRKKASELFKSNDLGKKWPVLNSVVDRFGELKLYDAETGTKLGQIFNTDFDYRRAALRKNGSVKAVLTTEKGTFTIDLLPEDAPLTVDNFIKLARANYFNGLEVHRVVPNFVMQDGDPRGDGNGGPGWSIRCEINMIPYERGAVGMALSGKDTGGSQWFVTHSPQPHLDGGYTVFGKVNETGMKVVDNIVRGDKIISVKIVGN